MQTHILTTRDADAWNGYLARLPGADIYHTPEYHAAHEANGDGTAICFVAEDGDNLLLHPVMVREIAGTEWQDIETVYGYSGPLVIAPDVAPRFLGPAWVQFRDWGIDNNVVAEFIRFNPFTGNQKCVLFDVGVTADRETVVLDLSGTPDDLWARYPKGHRYEVRKAERSGAIVWELCLDRAIPPGFGAIYAETMERNGASGYYGFSDAYFEALRSGLGGNLRLFGVQIGGELVAAALFMTYRDRMHYHLAGSSEASRGSGANNLLLHHAALWGQEHGYRWLHLGGGRTNALDDSLFRFKASISTGRLPFYVGKRIHNEAAYRQLCDEWRQRHPGQDGGGYFLLWRRP